MDEKDPATEHPMKNHPNAVNSMSGEIPEESINEAPQEAPQEPAQEAPIPKAYEPLPPKYQEEGGKKGLIFLIALILLLIVGAAAYWFVLKPKPAKVPQGTATTNSAKTTQSETSKLETDHHESPNFNLGFDFPKGWKVSDISGSGKLTVTSIPMKIKDTTGQTVDGQIIMTMRDKTQKLSEFDKGAAEAVIDSEKLTYTKPSETQRGDTYISFLSLPGISSTGLDAVYISGDAGYKKGQAVPAVDISRIDPITNVTFVKCSDSKCSGTGTALTADESNWQVSTFSKPIKTMLESLSIQ
jgi:hypothetical protein